VFSGWRKFPKCPRVKWGGAQEDEECQYRKRKIKNDNSLSHEVTKNGKLQDTFKSEVGNWRVIGRGKKRQGGFRPRIRKRIKNSKRRTGVNHLKRKEGDVLCLGGVGVDQKIGKLHHGQQGSASRKNRGGARGGLH